MPQSKSSRPRTLTIIFGAFFLVMAALAGYAGATLGYHYSPDITRWTFAAYLITAGVLLAGTAVAAVLSMRYLDDRIEKLERLEAPEPEGMEEVVIEETVSEDVPPPLEDTPSQGDHVDRDIDELLVSLQQMEDEAGSEEAEEAAAPVRETRGSAAKAVVRRAPSARLEMLKRKRDGIHHYFAGPALAAVAIIGLSAAMLPGSDVFLQSYSELNTALLLGIGYGYAGVACYLAASIVLLVRNK